MCSGSYGSLLNVPESSTHFSPGYNVSNYDTVWIYFCMNWVCICLVFLNNLLLGHISKEKIQLYTERTFNWLDWFSLGQINVHQSRAGRTQWEFDTIMDVIYTHFNSFSVLYLYTFFFEINSYFTYVQFIFWQLNNFLKFIAAVCKLQTKKPNSSNNIS